MDADRWRHLRRLFDEALDLLPEQREEFLAAECGGDADLRAEVEEMLDAARGTRALGVEGHLEAAQTASRESGSRVGEHIGPYRLLKSVGRGGMGEVYLAERADDHFEQTVAIKLVRRGRLSPDATRRFRSERQILARLVHPNIARLLDGGVTASGEPYLVMEAIEGERITEYCDRRGLGVDERLDLFRTVCGAVQFAHQSLVVHRDIKPSNILVTGAGRVKLLDFGIAKLLAGEGGASDPATVAELRVMTPDYAAPEQILAEPVTTATDVYALGVLLHELLVGQGPHADSASRRAREDAVLSGVVEDPVDKLTVAALRVRAAALNVRPAELRRRLSGDIGRVVLKALRSEPERRYGTAGAFADDVLRVQRYEPVTARPDTLGYRLKRLVRRRRVEFVAIAVIGLLVIGFGVVTISQARVVAQQRDSVQVERDRAEEVIQVLVDMFEASAPSGGERLDTLRISDFLQASEEDVLTRLDDKPELLARLQQVLGNVYAVRGQSAKAVELLTNAVQGHLAIVGEPDSMYASMLLDLTSVEAIHLGPAAAGRAEESLSIQRQMFGAEHPHVARALRTMANVVDVPAERRRLLTESLEMSRGLLESGETGTEDEMRDVAAGLIQLGNDHYRVGENREAETRYRQSLVLLEEVGPPDDERLLVAKAGLAAILNRSEDHAGALEIHRELLAIYEERHTGPASQTANTLGNIGSTYFFERDFENALVYLDSAAAMYEGLIGPSHGTIANLRRTIAFAYANLNDFERAHDEFTRAIDMQYEFDGGESVIWAVMLAQRSSFALPLGDPARGVAEASRALEVLLRHDPDGMIRQVATAREILGDGLVAAGDPVAGEAQLEQAIERIRVLLGADHSSVRVAEAKLAMALDAQGRRDEARRLLGSAIAGVRQARPFQLERIERAWARLQAEA